MEAATTNDRVLLITGTRKGIGKYLAEHYLGQGNRVIGCSRGPSSVEHDNYRHFQLDVTDEPEVVEMFRSISNTEDRLDVLINNAASLQ